MNEDCCVAPNQEPTISSLDEQLAVLVQRAINVVDNLTCGIYGNGNAVKKEDDREIESQSLASIQRRVNDLMNNLNSIETLTSKIHSG